MNSFATFFTENTKPSTLVLKDYYKSLNDYLRAKKGWRVEPIVGDEYYRIVVDSGITKATDGTALRPGDTVGKINRKYNSKTNTLTLDHISAAFDKTGLKRLSGLGIVNVIYPHDIQWGINNNIVNIRIEAVSGITRSKFLNIFGSNISKFQINQGKRYIIATRK